MNGQRANAILIGPLEVSTKRNFSDGAALGKVPTNKPKSLQSLQAAHNVCTPRCGGIAFNYAATIAPGDKINAKEPARENPTRVRENSRCWDCLPDVFHAK